MSWERIDLGGLEERGAITPSIEGLVYPGRRHIWSGPPESAKTYGALCVAVSQIRNGKTVLHIDFEMFAYETRDRLREMGLTDSELERFVHIEPDTPATAETIAALVYRWKPALVIIDAAAGA